MNRINTHTHDNSLEIWLLEAQGYAKSSRGHAKIPGNTNYSIGVYKSQHKGIQIMIVGGTLIRKIIAWGYEKTSKGTQWYADEKG